MQIQRLVQSRIGAVVAGAAVVALVGAGAGYSAGTITSKDIKNKTIKVKDLKPSTVKKLRGQTGPAGPAGPSGNAQTQVTTLGGDWTATEDDCGAGGGADTGNVEIAAGKLRFDSFNDGNARARVDFTPLVGKTLADLASLEYSAMYTQTGTDGAQGVPYFIVKIADGSDPGTDVDSVIFTPGTQAGPATPSKSGVWQRYSVTDGSGRFNDDPGAAPDVPWQDIVRDEGDRSIVRAGIQAGCGGSGTQDTVAMVDDIEIDVQGERTEYDFGG